MVHTSLAGEAVSPLSVLRRSHRMIGVVLLCWLLGSVPLAIGAGRLIAWGQGRARRCPRQVAPVSPSGRLLIWIKWQEPVPRSLS